MKAPKDFEIFGKQPWPGHFMKPATASADNGAFLNSPFGYVHKQVHEHEYELELFLVALPCVSPKHIQEEIVKVGANVILVSVS